MPVGATIAMHRSGQRVLIVEDAEERIKRFRAELGLHTLDVTDDTAEAIRLLEAHDYDLILLDHDLRFEHYAAQASNVENDYFAPYHDLPGTGREVSRWLRDHPTKSPEATIVAHSLNARGRLEMLRDLRDGGRRGHEVPFNALRFQEGA